VNAQGWDLTELRSVIVSLEEIFLQMAGETAESESPTKPAAEAEMESEAAHE
jgi:hypothetical protein